jgi:hypothetical protein
MEIRAELLIQIPCGKLSNVYKLSQKEIKVLILSAKNVLGPRYKSI